MQICRHYALKEVPLDERSKHRTKTAVLSEAKYAWFITEHCCRWWVDSGIAAPVSV